MPVRLIPNQLVKLFDTETLNQRNKRLTLDYRTYCQIVRDGQTTMFQVQMLTEGESIITNGGFEVDISGWNVIIPQWQYATGRLQGKVDSSITASISQGLTMTSGGTYELTLTIQFTNATSSLTVQLTDTAQTNQSTVTYTAAEYGTSPFTVTQYWYVGSSTVGYIMMELAGNIRDLVYIDDVSLYELTEPTVTLETCGGVLVETVPVFARSNDYLSYAVNWLGKDEGCYRVCMTGIDDTEKNYLDNALALATEGGAPLELEQGGYLKWYG